MMDGRQETEVASNLEFTISYVPFRSQLIEKRVYID